MKGGFTLLVLGSNPHHSAMERSRAPDRPDGAQRLNLEPPHQHPISAMGPVQVLDQGLTGLVLQLLQGGSADEDGQGFGLGIQVAGAFSQNAEHDLTHAGGSLSFRLHT